MKKTISVLVENQAGVLNRITSLFSRRAFNIDSLAVGVTDDPSLSRITIIVDNGNNMFGCHNAWPIIPQYLCLASFCLGERMRALRAYIMA